MSFTLDPSVPADSETPRNGASRIRSLTGEVLELFGESGSVAETYALPPIASVDKTTGLATVQGVPTTSLGIATKGYVDASTPSNVFVGSASGTNTITTTLAPVPANQAALAGFVIHLRIANANTGAVTFNPNGFGALAIVKNGNIALTGGELVAGAWLDLIYDTTNTNYQIVSPTAFTTSGFLLITGAGSGNFTVPAGVTQVVADIYGAGGGGGGGLGNGGADSGGGGGGGAHLKTFTTGLTPGATVAYVIGAGGTAGTGGSSGGGAAGSGGNGGVSTFNSISANGGSGSGAGGGAGGAQLASPVAAAIIENIAGSVGGNGSNSATPGTGAANYANGGTGGARAGSGIAGANGTAGKDGYILISW